MADLQLHELRRQFFEKADEARRLVEELTILREAAFPAGSEIKTLWGSIGEVECHWKCEIRSGITLRGGKKDTWRETRELLTEIAREPADG